MEILLVLLVPSVFLAVALLTRAQRPRRGRSPYSLPLIVLATVLVAVVVWWVLAIFGSK